MVKNSYLSGSRSEMIYQDPDVAKSFGSDRMRIHNTALCMCLNLDLIVPSP